MKFRWTMPEEEYYRLQEVLKSDEYESNNAFYGFGAGKMFVDILTWGKEDYGKNEKGNYLSANLYVAGVDGGYGNLSDGTPYTLVDDCFDMNNINVSGTFKEFKKSFEREFERAILEDGEWIEEANAELEEAWYKDLN